LRNGGSDTPALHKFRVIIGHTRPEVHSCSLHYPTSSVRILNDRMPARAHVPTSYYYSRPFDNGYLGSLNISGVAISAPCARYDYLGPIRQLDDRPITGIRLPSSPKDYYPGPRLSPNDGGECVYLYQPLAFARGRRSQLSSC